MYTNHESSLRASEFWTVFGKYMAPVLSAEGKKTQWLNYATGVKNLFFRMKAIGGVASISIELVDRDITQQQFYFHQLERQKSFLHHILEEEWIWTGSQKAGTGSTANVSKTMTGVSIDRREDWPMLITFFKPRIIALDQFWCLAKEAFQQQDLT